MLPPGHQEMSRGSFILSTPVEANHKQYLMFMKEQQNCYGKRLDKEVTFIKEL